VPENRARKPASGVYEEREEDAKAAKTCSADMRAAAHPLRHLLVALLYFGTHAAQPSHSTGTTCHYYLLSEALSSVIQPSCIHA